MLAKQKLKVEKTQGLQALHSGNLPKTIIPFAFKSNKLCR